MSRPAAGRAATGLIAAVTAGALAGCGLPALSDLPLPGGGSGGPAFHLTVEFADVLDLVPQSAVKVNDVTVGSVEKVWLSGWTARVRLRVDAKVRLPDNATAAIRQTSLLGEKFVALAAPVNEPAQGTLGNADIIPLARTRRSAEVEEVLAAFGLLLNGGGLAQLKTINEELATAMDGREMFARDALHQLDAFIGGLDAQKADIVRAIEALDRLSTHLAEQKATIGHAVDALAPGLTVLAEQRQQLTATLVALRKLGEVGTRVVTQSRADTVANLKDLQRTLDQLVKAGDDLPRALDFMLSYPFPPNITGAISGDFVNLQVTADLDAATILANLLAAAPSAPGRQPATPKVPNLPDLPVPSLPSVPSLPLPSLPAVPGLPVPTLTPLPSPTLPGGILPSLPGLGLADGRTDTSSSALRALLIGGLAP